MRFFLSCRLAWLLAALPVAARPGLPGPGTPAGPFGPATTYLVGRQPRALVLADVNGDGRLDIITANDARSRPGPSGGDNYAIGAGALLPHIARSARAKAKDLGSVSVLLGQATGGFRHTPDLAIGTYPTSLVVADLTHDGRPDLVLTCTGPGYGEGLLVLPAQASGGFGPAAYYRAGYQRTAELLALADLHADGWPAVLAISQERAGGVRVWPSLRQPTGALGPDTTYRIGPYYDARTLLVADATGDGRPDVLVSTDSVVVVLPKLAGGQLGSPLVYPAVQGAMALADLNHDGRPDLMVASAQAIVVRLGGPQGLGPATRYPGLGRQPATLRLADVNGDGQPDLLCNYHPTTLDGPGQLAVRPGRAGGGFGPPTTYDVGDYSAEHFAVGDLNGDGRPDLVVLLRNGGHVAVRLGQ